MDEQAPGRLLQAAADPAAPGQRLLPALHDRCPHLEVIALSGRPEACRAALTAGVDARVSTDDPPERLLAAVDGCRWESCE